MKRRCFFLPALALILILVAYAPDQEKRRYWGSDVPVGWNGSWPEKFRTVPEKTNFEETSTGQQILEFLNNLQWNSENITVFDMYTSELGRTCPVAVLANPRISTPDEAKATGKPVVYLQGGIHPG